MRPAWQRERRKPYTARGVQRLPCIRCGGRATFQWQICSDGNNYRPLCVACDVALNRLVLDWMGHPNAQALSNAYARRVGSPAHRGHQLGEILVAPGQHVDDAVVDRAPGEDPVDDDLLRLA